MLNKDMLAFDLIIDYRKCGLFGGVTGFFEFSF